MMFVLSTKQEKGRRNMGKKTKENRIAFGVMKRREREEKRTEQNRTEEKRKLS